MSEEKVYTDVCSSGENEQLYDTYAPVFQPIMPDEFRTADEKLDSCVEKMIRDTIGDVCIHQAKSKKTAGSGWSSSKSGKKQNKKSFKKAINKVSSVGKKSIKAAKGAGDLSNGKKAGIIIAALCAALALIYVFFAYTYKDVYFDGTFINGMDVGGMTPEEVEKDVASIVEDYTLEIIFRGGSSETISGTDVDYRFVSKNEAQEIKDSQPFLLWIIGKLGYSEKFTIEESTAYDRDKMTALVSAMPELQPENETMPTDAYLQIGEDNSFFIVPETEGNYLNSELLLDEICAAADKAERSVDFSGDTDVYETPSVRSDNEDLNVQMNDLNSFLSTTVSYTMYDGSVVTLDRNTLINWLDANEDGYYYINVVKIQQEVNDYITQLAASYDFVRSTRTFNSTARGAVQLPCAENGNLIDQTKETELLYADIINRVSESREPNYLRRDGISNPSFDGNYIEVDIENQHVYLYKDGVCILDSPCVSGLNEGDRITPKGIWSIKSKETDRTLRGEQREDGTYSYEAHVNYWMPFYQGYGLHDASWRDEFGGEIYKYGGSHGCVNLPEHAAKDLFDNIQVGTTVIVF